MARIALHCHGRVRQLKSGRVSRDLRRRLAVRSRATPLTSPSSATSSSHEVEDQIAPSAAATGRKQSGDARARLGPTGSAAHHETIARFCSHESPGVLLGTNRRALASGPSLPSRKAGPCHVNGSATKRQTSCVTRHVASACDSCRADCHVGLGQIRFVSDGPSGVAGKTGLGRAGSLGRRCGASPPPAAPPRVRRTPPRYRSRGSRARAVDRTLRIDQLHDRPLLPIEDAVHWDCRPESDPPACRSSSSCRGQRMHTSAIPSTWYARVCAQPSETA
jgi:hypothetical protein